jgi:hypothetical protein
MTKLRLAGIALLTLLVATGSVLVQAALVQSALAQNAPADTSRRVALVIGSLRWPRCPVTPEPLPTC